MVYWCFRSATAVRNPCTRHSQVTAGTPVPQTHHPSLLQSTLSPPLPLSLHSVGAIAPVVHCGRDGDYESGHSISCQVEVLGPGVLTLKYLHQHDVELHTFQEHPGKGCQEEKMEQGGEDSTGNLAWERKDGKGLYRHQWTGIVSFSLHFDWWFKEQIKDKYSRPVVHASHITHICMRPKVRGSYFLLYVCTECILLISDHTVSIVMEHCQETKNGMKSLVIFQSKVATESLYGRAKI